VHTYDQGEGKREKLATTVLNHPTTKTGRGFLNKGKWGIFYGEPHRLVRYRQPPGCRIEKTCCRRVDAQKGAHSKGTLARAFSGAARPGGCPTAANGTEIWIWPRHIGERNGNRSAKLGQAVSFGHKITSLLHDSFERDEKEVCHITWDEMKLVVKFRRGLARAGKKKTNIRLSGGGAFVGTPVRLPRVN